MNPSNTNDAKVITEMDVFESAKVKNTPPSNASSDSDREYSWNHVEIEDKKVINEVKTEVKEELKAEVKQEVKEDPKVEVKEEAKQEVKEEPKAEAKQEVKEELKAEVKEEAKQDVKELKEDSKVDAKEEPSIPDQTESDTSDDMPPLVEDSDDDMPDLVHDGTDQIMMAIFSKPDCQRCEAAMKVLMGHADNTPDNSEIELSEHSDSESDEEDEDEEKDSGVPAIIGGLFIVYLVLQIMDLINRLSGRSIQYCRPF